jgi:uncharacterized protein YkwD
MSSFRATACAGLVALVAIALSGSALPAAPGERSAQKIVLSEVPGLLAPASSVDGPQLAAPARPPSALGVDLVQLLSLPREIAAELNRIRRAHGLRALPANTRLVRAGVAHVRQLAVAGLFTHDWKGDPFGSWIPRYYPPARGAWSAGENLLWAPQSVSARAAVHEWLESAPHRQVMLGRGWRELGIGAVRMSKAPGVFGGIDVVIVAAEFGARR